jgi:thiol-disulfide isomerase/thioredoxin
MRFAFLRRRSLFPYLITSLLLCFFPLFAAAQDGQPTIRFVRNPDPAPDFKLTGLDGKPVTLADSKGKVLLLNFWATWCGPCRAEIPDLVELQNKYKDRLQILGLVVDDDDQDAIQKFVAEFGINYPVAVATDAIRFQYGGIPALPTSFVELLDKAIDAAKIFQPLDTAAIEELQQMASNRESIFLNEEKQVSLNYPHGNPHFAHGHQEGDEKQTA